MLILILGIALFLGAHVFSTLRGARAKIIEQYGLNAYKGAYSAVALLGLILIVYGFSRYRAEGMVHIWDPPTWARHVAMPLVWFAFVALASRRAPPSRIRGWLRHPTLVAIKSWAAAHLLANGDLGGMILFGSFLAFGVYDRIAVKRRGDEGAPRLDAFTRGDAIALGAGTALFAVVLLAHPYLFGVAVLRG
ncbi:NnrU family protein [Methylocystis parvus]|uniref:NnrU family protein n=1 Tax=Methylocystis parvus TaxID=134 RepID=A0A6B8M1Y3_9HYPH|nr:NnrU family protein [Methylocystis parvus]QGM97814.1 NnrU family protein [Methylocystis parvus]WBK01876.1 NnrU family protein [Methylocystis parvus OBBP]